MNDSPSPLRRSFATPEEAVTELERLCSAATDLLRATLDDFRDRHVGPAGETRQHFRYPELRVAYLPTGDRPSIAALSQNSLRLGSVRRP